MSCHPLRAVLGYCTCDKLITQDCALAMPARASGVCSAWRSSSHCLENTRGCQRTFGNTPPQAQGLELEDALAQDHPYAELQQRGFINERAHEADRSGADFSRAIRTGVPGIERP